MGSAQQFAYRFNGEGEQGQEKVFDMNGDVPLPVVGGILTDIYLTAQASIGLPAEEHSETVAMLRVVLRQLLTLCQLRDIIEERAEVLLENNTDYQRLRCIPGIGPITALTVLAEAGGLRRFLHHRQFLKFCGLDLATEQSGQFRGLTRLSKRGNARLRAVFWMAASVRRAHA